MLKYSALALAIVAVSGSATFAGFVATTGADTVINNNPTGGGADIGDSFDILNGTFTGYVPTTTGPGANDPQIQGDLPSFGYTIHGDVAGVAGNVVNYNGNYRIFYDLNGNNTFEVGSDASVSFGTVTASATFDPITGVTAAFTGSLAQTAGPSGPGASNFADFGARYSNNPVTLAGAYTADLLNGGATGTLASTLTQTANAVPEPTTLAALAGASAIGLRRRRA